MVIFNLLFVLTNLAAQLEKWLNSSALHEFQECCVASTRFRYDLKNEDNLIILFNNRWVFNQIISQEMTGIQITIGFGQ